MSADNEFERLLRDKLRAAETPPPAHSWERLQAELPKPKRRRLGGWYWLAASLVLLLGIGVWLGPELGLFQGDSQSAMQEQATQQTAQPEEGSSNKEAKSANPIASAPANGPGVRSNDANQSTEPSNHTEQGNQPLADNQPKSSETTETQAEGASGSTGAIHDNRANANRSKIGKASRNSGSVTPPVIIENKQGKSEPLAQAERKPKESESASRTSRKAPRKRTTAPGSGAETLADGVDAAPSTGRSTGNALAARKPTRRGKSGKSTRTSAESSSALALANTPDSGSKRRGNGRNAKATNRKPAASGNTAESQSENTREQVGQETVETPLEVQGVAEVPVQEVVIPTPTDSILKQVDSTRKEEPKAPKAPRYAIALYAAPLLQYRTLTPNQGDEWLVTRNKPNTGLAQNLSYVVGLDVLRTLPKWDLTLGVFGQHLTHEMSVVAQRGEVIGATSQANGSTMVLRPTLRQYAFTTTTTAVFAGVKLGANYYPGTARRLFLGGGLVGQWLVNDQTQLTGTDATAVTKPEVANQLLGLTAQAGIVRNLGGSWLYTFGPQLNYYPGQLYRSGSQTNVQPYYLGLHLSLRRGIR